MRTVVLLPFAVNERNHQRTLIIRYRITENGRWFKNGFLRFPMPIHQLDIYDRAYIEFEADRVYFQESMTITSDEGHYF